MSSTQSGRSWRPRRRGRCRAGSSSSPRTRATAWSLLRRTSSPRRCARCSGRCATRAPGRPSPHPRALRRPRSGHWHAVSHADNPPSAHGVARKAYAPIRAIRPPVGLRSSGSIITVFLCPSSGKTGSQVILPALRSQLHKRSFLRRWRALCHRRRLRLLQRDVSDCAHGRWLADQGPITDDPNTFAWRCSAIQSADGSTTPVVLASQSPYGFVSRPGRWPYLSGMACEPSGRCLRRPSSSAGPKDRHDSCVW